MHVAPGFESAFVAERPRRHQAFQRAGTIGICSLKICARQSSRTTVAVRSTNMPTICWPRWRFGARSVRGAASSARRLLPRPRPRRPRPARLLLRQKTMNAMSSRSPNAGETWRHTQRGIRMRSLNRTTRCIVRRPQRDSARGFGVTARAIRQKAKPPDLGRLFRERAARFRAHPGRRILRPRDIRRLR